METNETTITEAETTDTETNDTLPATQHIRSLDLPNVLIVGPSGSGKSSSIRSLDPARTIVVNTEAKRLPFRTEFPKQVRPTTWEQFLELLERALSSDADTIVIDSFTEAVELLYKHTIRAAGDDTRAAWGLYKDQLSDLFSRVKHPGKLVIFLAVEGTTQDDAMRIMRTAVVQGSWNGKVESQFEIVLWTARGADGEYLFQTQSDGRNTAKSPMGMLKPTTDNDLQALSDAIHEYYNYATTENQAA